MEGEPIEIMIPTPPKLSVNVIESRELMGNIKIEILTIGNYCGL